MLYKHVDRIKNSMTTKQTYLSGVQRLSLKRASFIYHGNDCGGNSNHIYLPVKVFFRLHGNIFLFCVQIVVKFISGTYLK
jgi:hypothetical protein